MFNAFLILAALIAYGAACYAWGYTYDTLRSAVRKDELMSDFEKPGKP